MNIVIDMILFLLGCQLNELNVFLWLKQMFMQDTKLYSSLKILFNHVLETVLQQTQILTYKIQNWLVLMDRKLSC